MRREIEGNIQSTVIEVIDVDHIIVDSSRKTNVVRENTGLICLDCSTNEKAFVE